MICKLVETRQYLQNSYFALFLVIDDDGNEYNMKCHIDKKPDETMLDKLSAHCINLISAELAIANNAIEQSSDEEQAVEDVRNIKRALVKKARSGATYDEAKSVIAKALPSTIVDVDKLYSKYLKSANLKSWAEFSEYVSRAKFAEVQ